MKKLKNLFNKKFGNYVVYFVLSLATFNWCFYKTETPEFSKSKQANEVHINFAIDDFRAIGVKISGFSGYEPWGRWIDSKKATIEFPNIMSGVVEFTMHFNCLNKEIQQGVKVYFGNHLEYFEINNCNKNSQTVSKIFKVKDFSKITLVPNYQIHLNNDPRNLSIGIISIALTNDLR